MSSETNTPRQLDNLKPAVMTLRVIVVALGGGVLLYAIVAYVVLRAGAPRPAGGAGMLTMMALLFTPLALVASRVLPAVMVRNARKQMGEDSHAAPGKSEDRAYLGARVGPLSFASVFQTKTLVAAALLEGAGFLAITAYLIEGSPIALGLGVGLAFVILAMFPSESRVAEWIEQQRRLANDEKLLSR